MAALDRREVVKVLLEQRKDLAVVTGLGSPTYDATAAGDHERNFYLWGAMGSAITVGLGLAQSRPDLPVLVLTGDGEQLMGLGGLATAAVQNPSNLTVVVLDNGHYGETGMQMSHSGRGISLQKVAAACGFSKSVEITEQAQLAALHQQIHHPLALTFASIQVSAEDSARVLPSRDGTRIKHRFRTSLGIEPTV